MAGSSAGYIVVEFPAAEANFSGEMAAELTSLVDRDLVRVLDLVLMRKDLDGSVAVDELHEVDASHVGQLRALEADLAMLLAAEDVDEIGKALEPGTGRGGAGLREQLGRAVCVGGATVRRPACR